MDALDELIRAGPDERYTVKAIVLQRHGDIAAARQLMRTWPTITEALGFRREQWKQVSACFRRVDASVKAGKLKSAKARVVPVSVPNAGVGSGSDYGGFDKPKPKRVFDDDK
jgi:hypothetical protein